MSLLLKKSLTIWIVSGLLVSALVSDVSFYSLNYTSCVLAYLYLSFIILYQFKKIVFIEFVKRCLLFLFSVFVFSAEKLVWTDCLIGAFAVLFLISGFVAVSFFVYLKNQKKEKFPIKLQVITLILEYALSLSIIALGVTSEITSIIFFIGMFDAVYGLSLISIVSHLNKRFNM